MKNFIEDLDIQGHLQISKRFDNGSEEVLFDDHNIIVSGMGIGLSYLFGLVGSPNILDYQIDRFQIGVSGSQASEQISTNQLVAPLSSVEEYGDNALLYVLSGYHAIAPETYIGPEWFGYIPAHKVSRVGDRSVRYTITLDKESCNNLTRDGNDVDLNEIGLYMKNPLGNLGVGADTSILVAYRYFSGITKTEDYSLIFRWTINW
jgi:hypothetical protein